MIFLFSFCRESLFRIEASSKECTVSVLRIKGFYPNNIFEKIKSIIQ